MVEGLAFGFAIYLYTRFSFKLALAISGCMLALCYMAIVITSDPYIFTILVALGMGYGSGGCGFLSVMETWKHFSPHWKGRIMSVASAAYGFSPMIWSFVFSLLCNPRNTAPDIKIHEGETEYNLFSGEVVHRVPWVSVSMGLLFAGVYSLLLIIFPASPAVSKKASLMESIVSHSSDIRHAESTCPDLKTALRSWVFWSLTLNMFCSITFGVFIINAYKNYGLTKYQDDQLMSSLGSVAAGLGALGRVFFSAAMDHMSFKMLFGVNMLAQLVAVATISYALETSVYLYGLCVAVGFSTFSGVFPVFILESNHIFGNK